MMRVQKRKMSTQTIEKWVMGFVLVLVLFSVIATVFPDVTSSASDLNSSGFPLAEFFLADGVLWLLVAAGLLFMLYRSFSTSSRK